MRPRSPRTSFFNISAREVKCATKSKSWRRKGEKVVCTVVQSSICICRHDEVQKGGGKERKRERESEREEEHACATELPVVCCALGVSSIASRRSRKRKRPRRLEEILTIPIRYNNSCFLCDALLSRVCLARHSNSIDGNLTSLVLLGTRAHTGCFVGQIASPIKYDSPYPFFGD